MDNEKQTSLVKKDAPETQIAKPPAKTGTGDQTLDLNKLTLNQINFIGKSMAESGMFADITDANQALVKILAGQEMGVPPFQAMSDIHIIKGKATTGAHIMAAKIKNNPKYNYRVVQHDNAVCEIQFYENFGNGFEESGVSKFTIEDARKAGTQNLEKFPRNMLFARAISNGYKWYAPDVFNGELVYVPEELNVRVDGNGEILNAAAKTQYEEAIEAIEGARTPDDVSAVVNNVDLDMKKRIAGAATKRLDELQGGESQDRAGTN